MELRITGNSAEEVAQHVATVPLLLAATQPLQVMLELGDGIQTAHLDVIVAALTAVSIPVYSVRLSGTPVTTLPLPPVVRDHVRRIEILNCPVTQLDLASCTALVDLNLADVNSLTDLRVGTGLTHLQITFGRNLRSVTIAGAEAKLKFLHLCFCYKLEMEHEELYKCTELQTLTLEDVPFPAQLDVSAFTALRVLYLAEVHGLEVVRVVGTALTELDVIACHDLCGIEVVGADSKLTRLEHLRVGDCPKLHLSPEIAQMLENSDSE